jgi:hypothetical protein
VSFVDFSETVSFSVLLIVFVDFSVSLRVETVSFVLVLSVGFNACCWLIVFIVYFFFFVDFR